jgi:hypothetical protein
MSVVMKLTTGAVEKVLRGELNLLSADLRVLLFDTSHAPTELDDFVDVITGGATTKEINGTGYIAGYGSSSRVALASVAVVVDSDRLLISVTADPSTWAAIDAGAIGGAAVFVNGTGDGDSLLVAQAKYLDPVISDGSPYQIDWDATDGVIAISLAPAA